MACGPKQMRNMDLNHERKISKTGTGASKYKYQPEFAAADILAGRGNMGYEYEEA